MNFCHISNQTIQSKKNHFVVKQSCLLAFGIIILLINTLSVRAGDAANLPALFRGSWTTKLSLCSDQDDTNRVVINGRRLIFWESTCSIVSTRIMNDENILKTKCSGEGEKWSEIYTLRKDGEKMVMRSDRDKFRTKTTYIRCP